MIKWSHKKSLLKIDSKMKTQFLQKQCFIISPFIKQGGKNIESTLGQSFLKLSDHQNHLKCSFKHRTLIPTSPELNRSGVVLRAYSSYKWSDLAFVCCYENHKMSEVTCLSSLNFHSIRKWFIFFWNFFFWPQI